eukprot:6177208-Pleurochrysis_carterae.AAC.1
MEVLAFRLDVSRPLQHRGVDVSSSRWALGHTKSARVARSARACTIAPYSSDFVHAKWVS